MTAEREKMKEEKIDKLTFQNPDFKFNVAYDTYSKLFDDLDEEKKKIGLNELITRLFENNISYPDFYNEIAEKYTGEGKSYRFHRTRIEGSRKFEYRRSEQKTDRIKRHKR